MKGKPQIDTYNNLKSDDTKIGFHYFCQKYVKQIKFKWSQIWERILKAIILQGEQVKEEKDVKSETSCSNVKVQLIIATKTRYAYLKLFQNVNIQSTCYQHSSKLRTKYVQTLHLFNTKDNNQFVPKIKILRNYIQLLRTQF
ncbi:unnamed protein product [Paramecium sonneborni]|uniref:Uncharacterized protein n=1 Tax=Paramecium sonneborni TaxID=65129 RepID=A0A8S1KLY2_9CILI|nr:unnamed protein product [Paramecium sonneborni]CAD8055483.1 unnamed protein product [Paramecium sonneborni]